MGGAKGVISVKDKTVLKGKGRQTIPAGERLLLEMPGGGGLGDPKRRPAELVAADVLNGMVSAESAREHYGVAVSADGVVDNAATAALRAS